MKRQALLSIAFSLFALNAVAAPATQTDPLFSDAVAAATQTDPLFSDAVAEGGSDRLLERRAV
ncbi:hypothetical protein NQ186_14130 [Pseudomonas zeae]|jgi:hypothetical protein|uniref:Uncharacterized protein n=1 Tax=Pseudomonas zeae TaxID=2745510 RepID=A0A9E6T9E0_9PSED|nr:hypothetical protein [Pseudomonas zeae]MDX9678004.1 hypothetical protein [Pseudomonas zeae]QXI09533.1 hypothetical protein HU754_016945 [Pseudomonas zeae]UUT15263.1 hypothetical protein NQ186_14130 [Pseudomonas zeae]